MDWKRKLTSRKFWAMLANTISQFCLLFNVSNTTIEKVANTIIIGGGFIAYMLAEGIADGGYTDDTTHVTIEPTAYSYLQQLEDEVDDEEVG